ncbi:hypothetical protein COT99_02200 [Candidatus Falkowbacteria bacterium CG10_big_fil_rev_8_21_14_0_10_43_10]|uniref:Inositol-1-monophosphatase n=1 Tax=Candidatus Falkowbacteria bacterium CG10_big_fil_rev_8_21_14_0_10_43_10 TaxID=1974567 RepID=A0A2H0V258_9BACT|nr:MAG: hypothetical protein COT99_02200 [Candidatus Falkowbacteria bacterium CG10_big_fil_rev_8_21_14_0_10_43_10]
MDRHLKFAVLAAEKTGKKLMQYFGKTDVSSRGGGVKTEFDFIADDIIKKGIEKNFPDYSYLTEETGLVKKNEDYLWVIDPLDGTGNFVNNNPFFSISIALWVKGKPVVGVIEAPFLQEKYIATKGGGSWVLKKGQTVQARVSAAKKLNEAYIIYCEGGEANKKRITGIFSKLYPRAKEVRKIGSAALECAWVGLGRADAYFTTKTNLWDIGAGVLFAKEAGGKILHYDGSPYQWPEFAPEKKYDLTVTNGKVKMPKL